MRVCLDGRGRVWLLFASAADWARPGRRSRVATDNSGQVRQGEKGPINGELKMGRFDSRNTTKMRRRRAQAKKKARAERRAEEVRAERQGKGKSKG